MYKEFDCVEMKREAASKLHEELDGKSLEERVEFWRKVHEQMQATTRKSEAEDSAD